ncbi:MAG: transcriptional regulator [Nitrososphaerota archaeon]
MNDVNVREGSRDEELKLLGEKINEPALRSSIRILILISLALNNRLTFTDLLELTGVGKGSLSNHLDKLEAAGLVESKIVRTFGGYRMIVSITTKGKEAYMSLIGILNQLSKR